MAYENSKETELASIDKNNRGDKIIIKKVEGANGNISVDIRQYYTSDDDQVLPTKKGVRFNAEILPEVMQALLDLMEVDELETLKNAIENDINLEDNITDEE